MGEKIVVVGVGEIGRPLLELIREHYEVVGVDIEPVEIHGKCSIMHICFPFAISDFNGTVAEYMDRYDPALTIINSTVRPATTRAIAERTGREVVHSPIRGKHGKMKQDLLFYTKFIGGLREEATLQAAKHFQKVGLKTKTKILDSPEATELAKLTETTYFGLLISWAQEVERYCRQFGLSYDDVASFYDEISFFPPARYFPGVIWGRCVMSNIRILKGVVKSDILDAIEKSNEMKMRSDERGSRETQ